MTIPIAGPGGRATLLVALLLALAASAVAAGAATALPREPIEHEDPPPAPPRPPSAPSAPAPAPKPLATAEGPRVFIDANADGRTDACRALPQLECLLSTGSGFGASFSAPAGDAGYDKGRAWADIDGNSTPDYCRVVGAWHKSLACTRSTGSGFGGDVTSGPLDPGWDVGRAWVDVNGDRRADYCRVVGSWDKRVQCTLSTGDGFGATVSSPYLDPGYDNGRQWADFNGDGKFDYCRVVESGGTALSCTLSTGDGFGQTITSRAEDDGWDDGRAWTDFDGDGRADYCRRVGGIGNWANQMQCTLSTGGGFGQTITSPVMDTGFDHTGAWADVDGDTRADYCREQGGSLVQCTLSTGSGFGESFAYPRGEYPARLLWYRDFNADGKADVCRLDDDNVACAVSTGRGFGGWLTGTW